jgi:adenylate cyclase
MMSDLRGFTAFSERLGPTQVVHMLNRYLGVMADIILKYQGTIDEFIGDAILCIFGAPITRPDDARRALSCAISMQLAMEVVNRDNEAEGLPRLEMGIAIHTGEVVVGNIGSDRRTKYGVVGPPVNITGRIESYTVGSQVLVSEATLAEAGPDVLLGEKIQIVAKGAKEPITIFPLKGLGTAEGGLLLPDHSETLLELEAPAAVRCWKLEGKHVGSDIFEAVLHRLSHLEAEMAAPVALETLSNVKLRFLEAGSERPGDVYVKITRKEGGDRYRVRFTAVPPESEAHVKVLLAGAKSI